MHKKKAAVSPIVIVAIAIIVFVGIFAAVTHARERAGLLHWNHARHAAQTPTATEAPTATAATTDVEVSYEVVATAETKNACKSGTCAPQTKAVEVAPPVESNSRPTILPWNHCPDGKCPGGKCPINVDVNVAPAAPAPIVAPAYERQEPAEPRFPWGLLLGVVCGVGMLAGGVAFAVRVGAAQA